MAQFQDLSIKSVVEEINKSFFIPDIQREYVWLRNPDERKIEQLFDSLLRGYPISSFLIWKLKKTDIESDRINQNNNEKLNIQLYKFIEKYDIRDMHNEKINIEQINSNDLYIVLDGQQRLTSLYIGLRGSRTLRKKRARINNPLAYEEKKLYINLKYIPSYENPDDNYEFRFLSDAEYSSNDELKHWFKVGDILNMDVNDVIAYSSKYSLTQNETKILADLVTVFCINTKISYFEETDKQLEKVLKIFIRVNSGGTQLSYSDLLMSILTANFSSDIRDLMNNLVDSLRDDGFGIMGRDQILKTCLFLTNSPHIFILRNFNKNNIRKIEENWEEIQKCIFNATKLLASFGYRYQLSSAYIITSIAYFYFVNKTIIDSDKLEVLKFIRTAQIKSYFTTSLDRKLDTIGGIIKNNNSFFDVNKQLLYDRNYPLYISEDDIERFIDFTYGHPATFCVLQILYSNLDYKNSNFHIDHIYPKSKFTYKNKLLHQDFIGRENELFNLQLLEGEANNLKRAKDPEIWLKEEFKTIEAIIEYKRRNYIKEELLLEWNNIKEFEEYRNQELMNKLKKCLL
jgi:uncharacterized protein with ParB-like and HNH nuclease domain